MTEQQVTDLLQRATADLRTGSDLVGRGVAQGRRRRRRHLVGTAAASVAVLGLAGTGLSLATSGSGAGEGTRVTDRPAASIAPQPTPKVEPAPRRFGVDAAKTGWVLGSLLTGEVTKQRSFTIEPDDYRAGLVLLDGAQVTIMVERTTLPGCGEQPPGAACDSVGDGFLSSATREEPASGGGPTGVFATIVTYFTADHFAITATAYNAAAEKGSAPLLDAPVLTVGQLEQLARDPVWLDEQQ